MVRFLGSRSSSPRGRGGGEQKESYREWTERREGDQEAGECGIQEDKGKKEQVVMPSARIETCLLDLAAGMSLGTSSRAGLVGGTAAAPG